MIFLSIGSNLSSKFGNRFVNIKRSISFLKEKGLEILKISSFYETPSYPNNKNPKFINVVLSSNSNFSILQLMKEIIEIEKTMGRVRKIKNEPRTCDIDIIDYNSKILNFISDEIFINVPHREMSKRNFVLYPLREINSTWEHPKTKENINILINKLSDIEKKSILKINND